MGDVCTFTVITKDCTGETTYSELDEVKVAIKLKSRQQSENLEPTNSQDGRYSVSYKPTTQGEYAVSININDIAIKGSPFILEVKEKLRDGERLVVSNMKNISLFGCPDSLNIF